MASDRPTPSVGPILRFQPQSQPAPAQGVRAVVLDTLWTAGSASREAGRDTVGLRDVGARVLGDWDLIAEAADRLDTWAAASGVVETLTIEGTSFWFYARLRHWTWLQEQLLWLALVDDQVREFAPTALECEPGCDDGLVAAAELIAARDGIQIRVEIATRPAGGPTSAIRGVAPAPGMAPASAPTTSPTDARAVAADAMRLSPLQRLARRVRPITDPPNERARRRAIIDVRLGALAAESGRLLVVLEHAPQRVETPAGSRLMNPYLGPIIDQLRGTALEPIEVEIRSRLDDDADWERLTGLGAERTLPGDVIWNAPSPDDLATLQARAAAAAVAIIESGASLEVFGVDLGPSLTARVVDQVRSTHAGHARSVGRLRGLLRRLRPSAILLADEYHRQEWLTAARLEGVPTVAVQHGIIHRWHPGYMHRDRPSGLGLADRTYVFGDWERRLLTGTSVYREDEVRVSGSPRLDLVVSSATDRDRVRMELGVAADERLVVISGTWGTLSRRFHYPIALAALVDRSLPQVHLVVKLHPGEPDEGPYRAVIQGVSAALGFEPPPVTIVRSVDLYRLLRAAEAHVGIYSTVLTEAVASGTLNLLADMLAASDLLGYVNAGVAVPVRDGGDLLAALDAGSDGAPSLAVRRDFLDAHFRPGSASERIAADLLDWPS